MFRCVLAYITFRISVKEGSLVFIFGRCAIGKVVSSEAYHEQDRLYKLKLGQKEKYFLGSYLELIKGEVQLWCLGCNTDSIPLGSKSCPACGLPLAPSDEFGDENSSEVK